MSHQPLARTACLDIHQLRRDQWSGHDVPRAESIRLDQVTDGPAQTLMVVEVANVQIPWTKPEDLDVRTMASRIHDRDHPSISSNHPGGAVAAFGDGASRFLPGSINGMGLKAARDDRRG